jgi:hypothetical protein
MPELVTEIFPGILPSPTNASGGAFARAPEGLTDVVTGVAPGLWREQQRDTGSDQQSDRDAKCHRTDRARSRSRAR